MAKYKKEKTNMPASYGGLMRYFEEYESKLSITPENVVFLCVLIIILELLMHFYGGALLG
jgi:preprotein translocase subunit Sec61beta